MRFPLEKLRLVQQVKSTHGESQFEAKSEILDLGLDFFIELQLSGTRNY